MSEAFGDDNDMIGAGDRGLGFPFALLVRCEDGEGGEQVVG